MRIGINPGNPVERSDDVFGVAVAVAARLCSLAEPGQILVSGVVRELVEDRDLTARLLDGERRSIRGLESALYVYRVEWQTVRTQGRSSDTRVMYSSTLLIVGSSG